MKIVCISDTHGMHAKAGSIPDGDTLVVAGDVTRAGTVSDLKRFLKWLSKLPHKNKIMIAGNHDACFQQQPDRVAALLESYDVYYLQDSAIILDGVKFYGSPWQPVFLDWSFNLPRGEPLKKVWAKIPDDVNVLVTHCPPHGVLDLSIRGDRTGCEDLANRIAELKELELHVFGHIHEHYGMTERDGVSYINASICTLDYFPVNKPVVVQRRVESPEGSV